MCGRFTLSSAPTTLAESLGLVLPLEIKARFNVAPTQEILGARSEALPAAAADVDPHQQIRVATVQHGRKEILYLKWGLETEGGKFFVINARAETLAQKRMFSRALTESRCIIFADGFYEWEKTAQGKVPHLFRLKSHQPFAFAGLWYVSKRKTTTFDQTRDCAVIITTSANTLVGDVHDRMPVILTPEGCEQWLRPDLTAAEIQALLKPFPPELMERQRVSRRVNNARLDVPGCAEPE